ncbi:MAG TPA: hypothetical protein VKD24_01845, partial [Candidatus Angelobacter sp.]|nr:hypothetical protein [Candidatus Angelobacter sp.]
MRSFTKCLVLTLLMMTPGLFAGAQATAPSDPSRGPASGNATKQEVDQLRHEVAEQRQTIDELKALVQQLVDARTGEAKTAEAKTAEAKTAEANPAEAKTQQPGADRAQVVNATLTQPASGVTLVQDTQKKPDQKKEGGPPVVAGWNNEHFFIRSA